MSGLLLMFLGCYIGITEPDMQICAGSIYLSGMIVFCTKLIIKELK